MPNILTRSETQSPSALSGEPVTWDSYVVEPARLSGKVVVSGAKNSVLRLMAASLLTNGQIVLENYPTHQLDVVVHLGMLRALGKQCEVEDGSRLTISEFGPVLRELAWEGRSIRNTLLILGALTARFGSGAVPLPGGCDIGAGGERKYDLHAMLLEQLGAKVWSEAGMLRAETPGRLKGAEIHLPIRSTGATENAILCGVLADGITRVWNPHIRPEIIDLVSFLNKLGAKITVFGQEHIEIVGVESLGSGSHLVMPDNIEALTWLIGAVMTGGDVEIDDFPFEHLEVPLIFLRESGARLFRDGKSLMVRGGCCYPVEISTGPYPGINSDMQPLFAAYGAIAKGQSSLIDLRFPGRYAYAAELAKLGVRANVEGNLLKIEGGATLHGASVRAVDLRAGGALTLTAFCAEGHTHICDAWQIERGYNRFVEKARSLGANIERV